MKNTINYPQRVLMLAKERGMFRSSDLIKEQIPSVALTRLVRSGQLEKVGRGLYCLPNTEFSEKESLLVIAKQTSLNI